MTPATWAIADGAVRELAPRALDELGHADEAARLRALERLSNPRFAGEAVSALGVMFDRLRELSTRECRTAVTVAEWALGVAMAAERGNEGLVTRRAESLRGLVTSVLDTAREEAPGR